MDQVLKFKEMVKCKTQLEKKFKINGVLTSCIDEELAIEQIRENVGEKVLFRIQLDATGLEYPQKWETCMVLSSNFVESNCNNCLFLNALVTAEQYVFNQD